jgi:NAD(P)-dependent dehydrogenase (short-subunit alcohol dehydrogenase family)
MTGKDAGAQALDGRHAVITGGSGGIGYAIAAELARLGARITLMGRSAVTLNEQAAKLAEESGHTTEVVLCDVEVALQVETAFAIASKGLGDPAILVNCAGQAESHAFLETPAATWQRLLSVNVIGPALCISQVLPAMLAAGSGRIVNIASTAGLKGYSHTAAYAASKHGVIGLTRALAIEIARTGITVNAVCPGYTETGIARVAMDNLVRAGKTPEEARLAIVRTNPLGRLIRPEEVAKTVGWLCSPDSGAITGQAIAVAGGEVM